MELVTIDNLAHRLKVPLGRLQPHGWMCLVAGSVASLRGV